MRQALKNINENVDHNVSPFSKETIYEADIGNKVKRFAQRKLYINEETGEEEIFFEHGVKERADKSTFLMLYQKGIEQLFEIPKPAMNVLKIFMEAYSQKHVPFDADNLYMNYKTATGDHGYQKSQQSWSKGINQLIDRRIIARHGGKEHVFFVNTALFFKGKRIRYIENIIMDESETSSSSNTKVASGK